MRRLDGALSVDDVVAVARGGERVRLADDARERMAESRAVVDDVADAEAASVYGVNTGFGNLKDVAVAREDLAAQQSNMLRSHHAAVGDPLPADVTRAVLVVRANALAVGVSGVRPALVERLCALLNEGVLPVIPDGGSVDNACELANVGLVLAGEGAALVRADAGGDDEGAGGNGDGGGAVGGDGGAPGDDVGRDDRDRLEGTAALDAAGLEPFTFGPKEGLALVSGTAVVTARAALAVHDLGRLVTAADLAGAWTFALVGEEPGAFDERVFEVRPVEGHAASAANVRELTGASVTDRADMTQDPLSIRCLPQVDGSLRATLSFARGLVESELASATDNPLVFPDGTARSCGNFNAQHVATAADALALATVKVGHASERRSDRLLAAGEDHGLSPHLASDPGLESGLARAQYVAASLVAEAQNGTGSDRNVVASTGQEDLHAAGNVAGANLSATVEAIRRVIAIELLCCARASALAGADLPPALARVRDLLEAEVGVPAGDVPWSGRIEATARLVRDGAVADAVREAGIDLV